MTAETSSLRQPNALVGLRSRKHIVPFALLRPRSAQEAITAVQRETRAAFMAGGLDLIDRMKNGEAIERVIFLDEIASLHGICRVDDKVVIGALTTHAEIACNDIMATAAPDFSALWRTIANPRVRHAGTIGGNLMSGLPHYDAAPALLALGAAAILRTATGSTSTIGVDQLPDHRDALLEGVSIADTPCMLLADRSLHPTLSVYLGARPAQGVLRSARIAVGCAFGRPVAVNLPVAGEPVSTLGSKAADIARAVTDALPAAMIDDGLASAAYRRRMCSVLIRRLLVRLGAAA